MMQPCRVVGINSYNFSDRQTGRLVNGYTYFILVAPENSTNFLGLEAKKVTMSADMMSRINMQGGYVPTVGSECWVDYDSKGKLLAFRAPDSMAGFVPVDLGVFLET